VPPHQTEGVWPVLALPRSPARGALLQAAACRRALQSALPPPKEVLWPGLSPHKPQTHGCLAVLPTLACGRARRYAFFLQTEVRWPGRPPRILQEHGAPLAVAGGRTGRCALPPLREVVWPSLALRDPLACGAQPALQVVACGRVRQRARPPPKEVICPALAPCNAPMLRCSRKLLRLSEGLAMLPHRALQVGAALVAWAAHKHLPLAAHQNLLVGAVLGGSGSNAMRGCWRREEQRDRIRDGRSPWRDVRSPLSCGFNLRMLRPAMLDRQLLSRAQDGSVRLLHLWCRQTARLPRGRRQLSGHPLLDRHTVRSQFHRAVRKERPSVAAGHIELQSPMRQMRRPRELRS